MWLCANTPWQQYVDCSFTYWIIPAYLNTEGLGCVSFSLMPHISLKAEDSVVCHQSVFWHLFINLKPFKHFDAQLSSDLNDVQVYSYVSGICT